MNNLQLYVEGVTIGTDRKKEDYFIGKMMVRAAQMKRKTTIPNQQYIINNYIKTYPYQRWIWQVI